ncbi:sugar-binding transcriptional regulator [Commensalibacter oyaizuii]|uniref:Sugar-binding transcriptional regulator n=1 Tax=Commensalibacter oyaizuii TaxID=3043873 RepID=A0ABT6Q160_9PROT|nr:sugar-binding transcriptional regulator [Commensalibacter sp. TBRC 16381]MDI2090845.1 sugar-binding transcriptional regulator [Commensalibacter sp. TBRC 16381]
MTTTDELRFIARVARMYYLDNMKQPDISKQLYISQATVSRLLKKAVAKNIVQISINEPENTFLELEEQIKEYFNLSGVIIAACEQDQEDQIILRIGQAAAQFFSTTMQQNEVIGISSWSESLLSMVNHLHHNFKVSARKIIQIQGGIGSPTAKKHASILSSTLAKITRAELVLLPAQGIFGSTKARTILMNDPYVKATLSQFKEITMALVGIGPISLTKLLADSGNILTEAEMTTITQKQAVGDICLHFYDNKGTPLKTAIDQRVIGITLEQLKKIPRVIGVAGGKNKTDAILGALYGRLVNVLVTDQYTAMRIIRRITPKIQL